MSSSKTMKNHFLKTSLFLMGTTLAFTSCVKTEELESVKAMRQAKVESITASTALTNAQLQITNADLATKRIQNAYDSVSNIYQLQIQDANAKYQVALAGNNQAIAAEALKTSIANSQLALAQAQSDIAVQVEQAKSNLANAHAVLLNAQANEINAINAQADAANNNPVKARLFQDYSVYYNSGTLTDGSSITKGIYTLKGDILGYKTTILTETLNKQNAVKTNAKDLLTKNEAIRVANASIANNARILAIGIDAKNTQDYSSAYNALTILSGSAYADLNVKKAAATAAKNTRDTAVISSTAATLAYSTNATAKNTAKSAMNTILFNNSVSLFNGLTVNLNDANIALATANKDLTDANKELTLWQSKYNILSSALNNATTKKNSAELAMKAAQYVVDTADVVAPYSTPAMNTDLSNKTTIFNDAVTAINDINAEYNPVATNYNAAQSNVQSFQPAVGTAQSAVDDLNKDILAYNNANTNYNIYLTNETSLLAAKTAKIDQAALLSARYDAAVAEQTSASDFYASVNGAKNAMKLVMDGINTGNTAIDGLIATTTKANADLTADIADLNLQIARIGNNDTTYDGNIAILNEKIDVATALVTLFEAKATALLAQINLL